MSCHPHHSGLPQVLPRQWAVALLVTPVVTLVATLVVMGPPMRMTPRRRRSWACLTQVGSKQDAFSRNNKRRGRAGTHIY